MGKAIMRKITCFEKLQCSYLSYQKYNKVWGECQSKEGTYRMQRTNQLLCSNGSTTKNKKSQIFPELFEKTKHWKTPDEWLRWDYEKTCREWETKDDKNMEHLCSGKWTGGNTTFLSFFVKNSQNLSLCGCSATISYLLYYAELGLPWTEPGIWEDHSTSL